MRMAGSKDIEETAYNDNLKKYLYSFYMILRHGIQNMNYSG